MAASSASDSGLTAKEVSLWFPDAEQKLRLMKLWMGASYATAQYAPDEWAHASWTALCASLREMSEFYDFVVGALEDHNEQMKKRPPRETHARSKVLKKQKRATTTDVHQREPTPTACGQNAIHPQPESAAADHDQSQQPGASLDASCGYKCIPNASPLAQARGESSVKKRKSREDFTIRLEKFKEHLLQKT